MRAPQIDVDALVVAPELLVLVAAVVARVVSVRSAARLSRFYVGAVGAVADVRSRHLKFRAFTLRVAKKCGSENRSANANARIKSAKTPTT